ncbi:MAG: GNAT family N-acetyltransferase [Geminicoccaceae bacterium]
MIQIRDIQPDDVGWLLRLNNASVPNVSHLERNDLDDLLESACYARMAAIDDRPLGALIGFWPGADYQSVHYRWFSKRFEHFFYVDRVIVADDARGKGVGQAIYADIERFAYGRTERIALEVNSLPPNPVSLRFHQAAGFVEVGEFEHEGGDKKVVMMVKAVESEPGRCEE